MPRPRGKPASCAPYSTAAAAAYTARVSTFSETSVASPGAGALPLWGHRVDASTRSGPGVARAFQRVFALILLLAWLSLGQQLRVLVGSHGLLPAGEFFERARTAGRGFWDEPSLLWLGHSDGLLVFGVVCGVVLALLALLGLRSRACFLLSAPLYLSYAVACSDFTSFQWDNLLIEAALLAACLPSDRPSALAHFAFRALLFKLYFESGIAKWQSHLHDWQDGSAMSYYYETAPIPAALAWYAHQLPLAWHRFESWSALVLELLVPLLIWGPRPARLLACAALTGFQLTNTLTANYGFFTCLAGTLHLFLLSDTDIARVRAFGARWLPRPRLLRAAPAPREARPAASRLRRLAARALLGLWLLASVIAALIAFARSPALEWALGDVYSLYAPFRVADVYHLFGHITRERIEPQFETRVNGRWQAHDFWYKPGDVLRPPPYVAPHQPRVDFQLWFYGLSFRRGMPRYVDRLLERLCREPATVQPLFASPLPPAPEAVRIMFYRYRFSNRAERSRSGAYWTRDRLAALAPRACR